MKMYIGFGVNIKNGDLFSTKDFHDSEEHALRAIRQNFYQGPIEAVIAYDGLIPTTMMLEIELANWLYKYWKEPHARATADLFVRTTLFEMWQRFYAEP